jgi:hypothetical protein
MMKHAVSLGKTGAYSAVLASLAKISLAQEVDQADVERLQGLLNTLRDNLMAAWNDFVEENNKGIEMFNE